MAHGRDFGFLFDFSDHTNTQHNPESSIMSTFEPVIVRTPAVLAYSFLSDHALVAELRKNISTPQQLP